MKHFELHCMKDATIHELNDERLLFINLDNNCHVFF